MTLTDEQIEEIKARAEAATPGPWKWWTSNSWNRLKRDDRGVTQNVAEPFVSRSDGHPGLSISEEDMAFISHARTDIPALLSALEAEKKRADEAEMALYALREENERYREAARGQVVVVNTASSRIKELEAVVVKLRETLEPFAEVAECDIGDDESDSDIYRPMDARYSVSGNISIGHLRRAHEVMEEIDWVADKIRALKGGVSEPSAPSEWQKRGPDFNEWEIEWERFATMLADAKGEYFWVCDGALKYLNIRLDTRSNAFILRDRDDNRIDPSRVEAAIRQCRDILGGVVKIDRDGRRELKENSHDKG